MSRACRPPARCNARFARSATRPFADRTRLTSHNVASRMIARLVASGTRSPSAHPAEAEAGAGTARHAPAQSTMHIRRIDIPNAGAPAEMSAAAEVRRVGRAAGALRRSRDDAQPHLAEPRREDVGA